ncbi:hypothetical protein [Micromonospora luteifusca]|uniref:hypothetical protein n=1 Tax=Micromonospora luteifusca TaxID=709860 RepID=UPI0033AB5731
MSAVAEHLSRSLRNLLLRIIGDHGPLALRELGDMLVCDTGTSPSRILDRLVNQLYDLLDQASEGTDIGALIKFLQGFTRQSPAGLALANRLAAEEEQTE